MATQPTNAIEVFYSYSHKDEELRAQLEEHLATLKRNGIIKGWHDRKISGGTEWAGQIDEHLNSADIILLLVSSSFLASDYCYDIEVKRAMERQEAGEARVIPIILRACDWQTAPFGKLQGFPEGMKPVKQWPDQDEAFLDIAKGIRRVAEEIKERKRAKAEEEARIETPKPDPQLLIPHILRVEFVERKDNSGNDLVKLLQAALAPQRPQLVALWGAGGVGKTAIAAEAARGLIETFAGRVVWVSADGLKDFGLTTLLDGIASQLGHADLRKLALDLKKDQVREVVITAPTLVVLDNFETIEPDERARCVEWLADPAPCSALITTRDVIDGARNIPIEVMRPEEAHDLLNQLIAQAHEPRAFAKLDRERLIKTADANPLVLQWIVGQIDLAQDPEEVLDDLRHGEGTAAQRVFNRSFELSQLNNGGRAVLLALSLFAPSATRKALAEVSGLEKDKDRKRFRDAVRNLSALWLIRTTDESQRLAVEGLTRELTKARLETDPRGKTFPQRFVTRFLRFAKAHDQPKLEDYNLLETEKDNLLGAADTASTHRNWKSVIGLAYVLAVSPDGMLYARGYWDETLRIGGLALAAARVAQSELHIADWTHNIAMIYQERGELAEAQRLYSESLEITKKLGSRREIAITLHQLGYLAQDQGELTEARRLYDESLKIKQQLGDEHLIAVTLHQLGTLHFAEGDYGMAEKLLQESLLILRKLGDKQNSAECLESIGKLRAEQGQLSEAAKLFGEALSIAEAWGIPFRIASVKRELGLLAERQNDKVGAEELLREAVGIFEKLGSYKLAEAQQDLARVEGRAE